MRPSKRAPPTPLERPDQHKRQRHAFSGSAAPSTSTSGVIASAVPTLVPCRVRKGLAQTPLRSQHFFPPAAPANVDNSSTHQGPEHSATPIEASGCSPTSECNELMQVGRATAVTPVALDTSTFEAPMRVPRSEAQRCGTAQRTVEAHQAGDQFFCNSTVTSAGNPPHGGSHTS
ncbi:hypothetical protein FA13DRAFT_109143 [Coprinellus micaceus]|uniref:Uncharacterized protein n=1 Tax=Coprinellus micaceus TaxID=71717 RepID=A0A4Y7THV1_COPMI|nr:hypothetical protein FA13DRAFT_109143 [Coprinellus micaceus]